MPPKKKNAHTYLANFSNFEMALLRYLAELTRRQMAKLLRDALRVYARQHPHFSPAGFAKYVRDNELSQVEDAEERRDLKREVDVFIAEVDSEAPTATYDTVSGMGAENVVFDSAEDFGG